MTAYISTPQPSEAVKSLHDFLRVSGDWHSKHSGKDQGMLSELWYRGVNRNFDHLAPGVYRPRFSERAAKLAVKGGIEEKRLRLERDMLSQFRTAGAAFLDRYTRTQIYFAAQHFGMPTRLLDWSANPLAALFFACDGESDKDGYIYAMNAKYVIPADAEKIDGVRLYPAVMTMRHAFVEYAVGLSFWDEVKKDHHPFVLPVRPDAVPGRIGQQPHPRSLTPAKKSGNSSMNISPNIGLNIAADARK